MIEDGHLVFGSLSRSTSLDGLDPTGPHELWQMPLGQPWPKHYMSVTSFVAKKSRGIPPPPPPRIRSHRPVVRKFCRPPRGHTILTSVATITRWPPTHSPASSQWIDYKWHELSCFTGQVPYKKSFKSWLKIILACKHMRPLL